MHSNWWWWREFRYEQQLLSPVQILRYYCTITDTLILLEFTNSTNAISEEGNARDVTRLGGVAARMMDEYLGDRTGFIELSNHYGLLLKEHDFTAQTKAYKDAPISTKRFIDYLALADKHPAFVEFRTALDD